MRSTPTSVDTGARNVKYLPFAGMVFSYKYTLDLDDGKSKNLYADKFLIRRCAPVAGAQRRTKSRTPADILMQTQNLQLLYTLLCDDVRIEMGNKISLMGVFQNILVEKLPVSLIKFAVINHWQGEGNHQTEVRIMSPDRRNLVVTSQTDPDRARGRRLYRQRQLFCECRLFKLPAHIGCRRLQTLL